MNQIKSLLIAAGISACALASSAQTKNDPQAYRRTVEARAGKIVQKLNLKDNSTKSKVAAVIADHYVDLNTIYTKRDSSKLTPESAEAEVNKLHQPFLNKLSAQLNAEQVDQVKDGLTYGVLPITYTAYQDMLPQLNADQKKQILTWLTEAREKAMDAESAEHKHGWFKKYKGRINNYLSAAGIDMKKEGEAWQQRIKAKANASS